MPAGSADTDRIAQRAAFAELARSPQQKTVIVPAEMGALVGTLAGVGQLVGLAQDQQNAPRATPPRPPRTSTPRTE